MPENTSNLPQPESDSGDGRTAPDGNHPTSETRIDRPHVMPTATEPGSIPAEIIGRPLAEISDLDDSADGGKELHRQADELAAYLSSRLKEFDHRESLLNTRSAQLDAALRLAQATLNERQAELARREQELVDRERHPKADRPTETESQPTSPGRRLEQIKRREAALVALRKESDRVYAHAADMCAAAEELWEEMSHGANRAALATALNKVRTLSDEHNRDQDRELAEKKRRLENVRRQLLEENRRMQAHEIELRQWVQQRELTLQRRAAKIAAKEAKLRRKQPATDKLV